MRHRLFIPAATALLFALAACTQDELAGDNRLPEGEYPVVIRATGLSLSLIHIYNTAFIEAMTEDWNRFLSVVQTDKESSRLNLVKVDGVDSTDERSSVSVCRKSPRTPRLVDCTRLSGNFTAFR